MPDKPDQSDQPTQEISIPPAQPGQVVATPQQVGTSDVPATTAVEDERALAGPSAYGGVSWEEVRKGQPPRVVKNPDQAVWSDRFTSELQMINMTGGRWKPVHPLFVPE
ncbi:MAG TPA: hypothetical protein VMU89_18050 [Thermomicrobiaceae bacterium]|nr:hypothetical protein [Thermomicrobiaceae bacterium]